jgi:hypothetical protein
MEEQDDFRLNWPAIILVILGLVIIGWLLGRLADAPDGGSISCPSASQVSVMQTGEGDVVVYCED